MKENRNKELDDFVRKVVKEAGLEKPSLNFTETLLSKIDASGPIVDATLYKPLISKMGWGITSLIIVGLCALAVFGKVDTPIVLLDKISLITYAKDSFLDAVRPLELSDTMSYSILIFLVFIMIQIALLKYRLDRRYTPY
jgi:hypothetical protein